MSEDWFSKAKELDKQGIYTQKQISEMVGVSEPAVQSRFYRDKLLHSTPPENEEPHTREESEPLKDAILKDIQKGSSVEALKKKYRITDRVLTATITDLSDMGYDIQNNDDTLSLKMFAAEENKSFDMNLSQGWHKMGVVSDTHLSSKCQQLSHLIDIYDKFTADGVEFVIHSGDICDGNRVYKGHEFEVFNIGADEQIDYAVRKYPRANYNTYLIAGNHDLSYYTRDGIDICKRIAKERSDIQYLGQLGAYLRLNSDIQMYLLHPNGGMSYALSYRPQKIITGFLGGQKPKILIIGHFHQAEYLFERNIHTIQALSFQSQTSLLRRMGIMPKMGGWIVDFHIEGTSIDRFKTELITYYYPIEHDY